MFHKAHDLSEKGPSYIGKSFALPRLAEGLAREAAEHDLRPIREGSDALDVAAGDHPEIILVHLGGIRIDLACHKALGLPAAYLVHREMEAADPGEKINVPEALPHREYLFRHSARNFPKESPRQRIGAGYVSFPT